MLSKSNDYKDGLKMNACLEPTKRPDTPFSNAKTAKPLGII